MPITPHNVQVYHVFLASPGDVNQERRAVRDFFEGYNRHTAHAWGVRFEVIDWENHATIGVGRPQELITQQTLERFKDSLALVVGIMAQRFGSPTGKAESGTEEEFRWALTSNRSTGFPEIKWFFRKVKQFIAPSDPKEILKAANQWENVLTFKEEMKKENVFFAEYPSAEEFHEDFQKDLNLWLAQPERPWVKAAGGMHGVLPPVPTELPKLDLDGYGRALRGRYGKLKLESLDPTGCYYRELELWRVFVPQDVRECQEYLPRVLELPKEHLRRLRESGQVEGREIGADEMEELRRRYLEQQPRNVLELAADPAFPRLVILGDPGSGKSSLLQALALQWADTPAKDLPNVALPLIVELRLYAQARRNNEVKDFLDYFHSPFAPFRIDRQRLEQLLKDKRTRVFFDGLDEVFDPGLRSEVVSGIQQFTTEYDRAGIIVTSRVIGYQGETFRAAGFRHFMLQELDDPRIAQFLHNWHRDTYRPSEAMERDQKRDRLARAIEGSRAIRELAGNPLLLTMMAILNRNQDLPRDRTELYEQCSRLLLFQWKAEEALRGDPDLSGDAAAIGLKEKQTILRRLAREMQSGSTGPLGNIVSGDRLETVVAESIQGLVKGAPLAVARALIRHLRERNFILCFLGADSYGFVHRTFLEYFCADDVRMRFDHEKSLDLEELKTRIYGLHWPDETWHEVLCLLAGMIHSSAVAGIIEFLLEQNDPKQTCLHVFLAARCVGEVRKRDELGKVSDTVFGKVTSLVALYIDDSYIPSDEEGGLVFSVRMRAVSLAAQIWREKPETLLWLKKRAQEDENWDVRQTAVEELARGWRDHPDTLTIVKDRAQKDEDWVVRWTAVQELARGWRDHPDTLTIIKNRAQKDEDEHVRETAVQELARGWRDHPDTLTIIKDRAQKDEDWFVRETAMGELARGWKNDTDTLTIIKDRAQADESEYVRESAVQELARGWRDHPDTLTIIKDRAQKDKHSDVRSSAMQELARGWKNDPEVQAFLIELKKKEQKRTKKK